MPAMAPDAWPRRQNNPPNMAGRNCATQDAVTKNSPVDASGRMEWKYSHPRRNREQIAIRLVLTNTAAILTAGLEYHFVRTRSGMFSSFEIMEDSATASSMTSEAIQEKAPRNTRTEKNSPPNCCGSRST